MASHTGYTAPALKEGEQGREHYTPNPDTTPDVDMPSIEAGTHSYQGKVDTSSSYNGYDYPGNIRELKNIIERFVVLARDGVISHRDIPSGYVSQPVDTASNVGQDISHTVPLREFRKDAESSYIQRVLEQNNYNMTQTSKVLGISRRQLFNKITEYGIKKDDE